MTTSLTEGGQPDCPPTGRDAARFAAYFCELDAWTEYWDLYHPETKGRFYCGHGDEPGLLRFLIPLPDEPPVMAAWKRAALTRDDTDLRAATADLTVADAVLELGALVGRIFGAHFGDARDDTVRSDYLRAMHLFAIDALPPATDRLARMAGVSEHDPRWRTAGRHTIDADMMWFVWALQLEAAHLASEEADDPLRALLLAGVATGCSASFAWRGHRRTRAEYRADDETARLLHARGLSLATDIDAAIAEVRALYRICEYGHP